MSDQPYIPDSPEVQRKIREMEEHLGVRKKKRKVLEAADELGPPDTGANLTDFRLASRRRRNPSTGYA